MKYLVLFMLAAVSLTAGNITQKISDIPEELVENADQVYLEDRMFLDVISKKEYIRETYMKIAVMNDDSHFTSYSVGYDRLSSVKNLKITVYDEAGKKIETYKKKDFMDVPAAGGELYTENRALSINLERHKTPYILEIESTEKHVEDLLYASFMSQGYNSSVISGEFKVRYPESLGIQYQAANGAPEPNVSHEEDLEVLEWSFENLPAIDYESGGPYGSRYFPMINIRPKQFLYDGHAGSMETWMDYNDFYYNLNKDRDLLSDAMKAKVAELTSSASTDQDKIKVLYGYLKDNMRYVSVQLGIGGWQTFDANYVEHNKFGDCKALSNFMGGMLKEVGIENHKVLIYRGQPGYMEVSDDFVNTAFNHAIIYIPQEEMFLECTSNSYPAGYLGLDNADHKVLISTEDGPLFMKTPYMGKDQNKKITRTTVEVLETGGASITSNSTRYGGMHDYLRNVKQRRTTEELEEGFQEGYSLAISDFQSYEITLDPDHPQLDVDYKVSVGNYASKAGKRFFIPVDPIHGTVNVPAKVKERQLPFSSRSEVTIEDELTILVPEGYEIESVPEDNYSDESEYADYRMSITKEGNVIKVYKKWVSKKYDLPAEKYEDYRTKMKEYANLDRAKIVLVKKKT